jgi:hypothetical protein
VRPYRARTGWRVAMTPNVEFSQPLGLAGETSKNQKS